MTARPTARTAPPPPGRIAPAPDVISERPHLVGPDVATLTRERRSCRCGHPRETHSHYRTGTDCGTCACARFSAAPGRVSALVDVLLRRRATATPRS